MVSVQTVTSWGKDVWQSWSEDDGGTLAASVAFYAIFSLAPLLVLAVAIAGLVFGEQAAQGQLTAQIEQWVGSAGAEAVQTMLASAGQPGGGGIVATIVSLALLFYGASKVLLQLQKALNRVWNVRPDPEGGLREVVRKRLMGFVLVLGIGVFLIALIALSTFLGNIETLVGNVPGGASIWMVLNFAIQVALITVLFGAVFKYIPDVEIAWSDVWRGAGLTALLFVLGQFALSLYLSTASVGSAYGAAGSLVALLAWIFYSTQILFLGAEFTDVYMRRRGRRIKPDKHAVREERGFSREEQPV